MALNVKANNATRARNRIFGILIAICLIVFVCVMTAIGSAESKKTISVVKLKEDTPIKANSLVTEDMIEKYDMYYKEFEQYGTIRFSDGTVRSSIVKWDDRNLVVGQRYAAYYLREDTVLFWNSTIKEQSKKNSYLYTMSGELLNIQMNTVQDFGDMVVPGDSLNNRALFNATVYDLPTEAQYKLTDSVGGVTAGVEMEMNELLFSEVTILDMLNSQGNSIFDIYYEYISMSKAQQKECLENDEFLESVQPQSILLEVTAEEVERYMKMQGAGATYQITLLPRKSSSSITDSLSDIQEALAGIAGK